MGASLLFTYDAGVASYLRVHCSVGDALEQSGDTIYLYLCPGNLNWCPMLGCHKLTSDCSAEVRKNLCERCQVNVLQAADHYGWSIIDGRTLPLQRFNAIIDTIVKTVPDAAVDFVFDGMAIGKAAAFSFTIETKLSDLRNINSYQRELYIKFIRDVLLQYLICDSLIQQYALSTVTTFDLYSSVIGVTLAARRRAVKSLALCHEPHLNSGERWLLCLEGSPMACVRDFLALWQEARLCPLAPSTVTTILANAIERFQGKGTHLYSPTSKVTPEELRQMLDIPTNKKVVVCYTNSLDERVAQKYICDALDETLYVEETFEHQIAWLQALQDWATVQDDVHVLARIHPRECDAARGVFSDHLLALRDMFPCRTENFQIIWPEEDVSSYLLGELADVVATSWGSMGREFARLGVPMFITTQNLAYPADICAQYAPTPQAWLAKLREAVSENPADLHSLKLGLRMDAWCSLGPTRYLSQCTYEHNAWGERFPHLGSESVAVVRELVEGRVSAAEANVRDNASNITAENEERETVAIRQGVGRFLEILLSGEMRESPEQPVYVFTQDMPTHHMQQQVSQSKELRIFCATKGKTILLRHDGVFQRTSKLSTGLVRILARCAKESL